jgi:hypothetical protein
MARCAAATGEVDLACRWFDLVRAKSAEPSRRHEYADFLAYIAVAAFKRGDWTEAARQLKRAMPLSANT